MKLAPIIIFTYIKLETLILTIEALQNNYLANQSDLIIFSDGAKNSSDFYKIQKVRNYIKSIIGFNSIVIYEAVHNKGLARSVIDGVSLVLESYDQVIVLEDDLDTNPNFLNFMNNALKKYANSPEVFSISAFAFNLNLDNKIKEDAYFLNRGWSWGWATWKNQWKDLDWEIKDYTDFIQNRIQRKAFSLLGSDVNSMLDVQMKGKIDSWAIRWFYNQFKRNKITLYPVKSLVKNIGFGIEATHTTRLSKRYIPEMMGVGHKNFIFPVTPKITTIAQKKFAFKMGYISRFISKIEILFSK